MPTVSDVLVDDGMMFQYERAYQTLVENMRAALLSRSHQPDEEKTLD